MRKKDLKFSTMLLLSLLLPVTLEAAEAASTDSKKSAQQTESSSWEQSLKEGDRLLALKELDKAQICYESAYDELRKSHTGKSDDLAQVLLKLADLCYKRDLLEETVPLYKKALKILSSAHGAKSPELIPALTGLGAVYDNEGDYKKAQKEYQRARLILSENQDQESSKMPEIERRLAGLYMNQGNPKEAEDYYFNSLKLCLQNKDLSSSGTLQEIIADYMSFLLKLEDTTRPLSSFFQAELLKDRIESSPQKSGVARSKFTQEVSAHLANEALSKTVKSQTFHGGTSKGAWPDRESSAPAAASPSQAGSESNSEANEQIYSRHKFSDFAALEKLNQQRVSFYERMIAADIDSLGADHPSVARDLSGLASIYIASKNYKEAKPLLARAVEIYKKNYQSDSVPAKQAERLLAIIKEDESPQTQPFDPSYRSGLPSIPLAAQKLEIAYGLNDLGFLLYCQGKIERSLEVYRWALATTADAAGTDSLLAASSMNDLSRLLRMSGDPQQAAKLEGNARAIYRQELLSVHPRSWQR